jgi:hypothetical protein
MVQALLRLRVARLALPALLAGCSVADAPYPPSWEPLPPSSAGDCRRFQGTYADRGDAPGQDLKPSLTRELFGPDSQWEKATSIRFDFTDEDALDITVNVKGVDPVVRRFTAKSGEFVCDRGMLVLSARRWVASDLMSGRESVKIELHQADPFLVTHVYETITGVMFLVVPLSGESARWFRFQRLKP